MHSLALSPHSHVHILPFTWTHNTQTHIHTSHTFTHHTHISHITHTLPPPIALCLPTQGVSCRGVAGRWATSIRREYTLFVARHTHKGKKKGTLEWSTLNFSLVMFFLHSSDIHFLQIALCSNLKYLSPLHCIAHTYHHSNNLYSNHWCACVLILVK